MHEYDVALKSILMRPGSVLLHAITGHNRLRWLNVEQPKVNNRRVDLLGAEDNGDQFGIELQAKNEKNFRFRMGSYLFGRAETDGCLHTQIALYVGDPPLRMKSFVEGPNISYRFHMVDIRDIDGEPLLASGNLGDNVVAILTRLGKRKGTVGRILKRIAAARPGERALAELGIIAGLRKLGSEVGREAKKMPILNDIMDHDLLGPLIRQGRVEGRVEGQMEMLLGMMEKRFGKVPARIRKQLAGMKPEQLRKAGLRLLDADRIDDIFA